VEEDEIEEEVTSWEVRKETLLGEEERFTGEMEEELEV
jgi:hypothetical protein